MKTNSNKTTLPIFFLFFILPLILTQTEQQTRQRIQNQQSSSKQRIGLIYGQNTQIITFSMTQMSDFIIRTQLDSQQIKFVVHTYWKQDNTYKSSQYKNGENMRVLIYENNYKILVDAKFYMVYGFKFQALKGISYTIRFMDEGKIMKLIALELSRSSKGFQKALTKNQMQTHNRKLNQFASQVKVLQSISSFATLMHERNAISLNKYTSAYYYYLIFQAMVVIGIVLIQVRVLTSMLKTESIV